MSNLFLGDRGEPARSLISGSDSKPRAGEVSARCEAPSSTTLRLAPPEPGMSPNSCSRSGPFQCQACRQARICSLAKLWSTGSFYRAARRQPVSEPPAGSLTGPHRPRLR